MLCWRSQLINLRRSARWIKLHWAWLSADKGRLWRSLIKAFNAWQPRYLTGLALLNGLRHRGVWSLENA